MSQECRDMSQEYRDVVACRANRHVDLDQRCDITQQDPTGLGGRVGWVWGRGAGVRLSRVVMCGSAGPLGGCQKTILSKEPQCRALTSIYNLQLYRRTANRSTPAGEKYWGNKLRKSEYDEATWSTRTWTTFAAQRIACTLTLAVATDGRRWPLMPFRCRGRRVTRGRGRQGSERANARSDTPV